MAQTVTHKRNANPAAEITDRFLSPNIWSGFPDAEKQRDPSRYFDFFDDFDRVPSLTAATTAVNRASYMSYIDTSDTIVALATEKNNGVLRLSVAATDNNGPVITFPGDTANCMVISDTAGDDLPAWFEARWRKSSVTDNQCAVFIGVCEEGRCINNGVLTDDDGVLADIDHIGFNVAHDNGEELNFAFTKSGQTDTELIAALDSLVASTWVKTGFRYDPGLLGLTTERIKVFLNNAMNSTFVTATQIAAATFPDAEEMTFAACAKAGEATAVTFDIDWLRIAQKKRAS